MDATLVERAYMNCDSSAAAGEVIKRLKYAFADQWRLRVALAQLTP